MYTPNEGGVKLAAHSTLQAAGVPQCAVWGTQRVNGLTRNPNKGIAKKKKIKKIKPANAHSLFSS